MLSPLGLNPSFGIYIQPPYALEPVFSVFLQGNAKDLFHIKALGKVVAGISWGVREGCMCWRERVNEFIYQLTRKQQV